MSELQRTPVSRQPSLGDLPISIGLIVGLIGMGFHSFQLYRIYQHLRQAAAGSAGLSNLHTFLVLGFLFCIVGLLLRSRLGLILSILSLSFVLFLYAKWYQFSYGFWKLIREFSPSPEFIPSHPLGLVYARWLDIAILFAVVVVLVWQIKFLIGTLRHRNESK